MGHVIHKVKVKVKRSLPLNMHLLFWKLLTEMESLCNFLQNDTKFVQIPQVVAKISLFEIWRVPPFFAKKPIFEGACLQYYSSDFNKIDNIGFFYKLYMQTKFHANRRFLGKKLKKIWVIWRGIDPL